jgi:hypothetical protein
VRRLSNRSLRGQGFRGPMTPLDAGRSVLDAGEPTRVRPGIS